MDTPIETPRIIAGLKNGYGGVGDLVLLKQGHTIDPLKDGMIAIRGPAQNGVTSPIIAVFQQSEFAFVCTGDAWGSVCRAKDSYAEEDKEEVEEALEQRKLQDAIDQLGGTGG